MSACYQVARAFAVIGALLALRGRRLERLRVESSPFRQLLAVGKKYKSASSKTKKVRT